MKAEKPHYLGHRERLRTRFQAAKGQGFADYELLELLLTYAIPRRDVKPLAKDLLHKFKSFKGVLNASTKELSGVRGVGAGASLFFPVLREAMNAYLAVPAKETDLLNSPQAVVTYCRSHLEGLKNEVFDVLYLSTKNRVIGRERLSEGTIDQTAVYPRRVVAGALAANAAALIFVHNHPSGDPTPSPEDRRLTQALVSATAVIGVAVHDHIVIGDGRHFSFREKGLLPGGSLS